MKTNKIFQLTFLLIAFLSINSCVENNDFDTPNISVDPVVLGPNDVVLDIGAVLAEYNQRGEIFTYESLPQGNRYMTGYVVSSDEGGNFFEELVIQDKSENPSAGIVIQVDVSPLFTSYEFGRKIYVKLDGLSVNVSNGVVQVGVRNGDNLAKIPAPLRAQHIIRDSEIAEIIPLPVSISDFSEDKENLYIRLTDVQFSKAEIFTDLGRPLTYAGEALDQFDGERTLQSCADNSTVTFSTSTFSDFKSLLLPAGKGTVDGILTRDFFDDFYTVYVNSPEDINFDDENRCDPDVLDCTGPVSTSVVVFEEDFESITNEGQLDGMGWTNINVSGGSERYERNSFSGDSYLKISAFGTNEDPLEAWLVTPGIDMDNTTQEELSFNISTNFETGKILTAYITNNYTGDPLTTTWTELDANIPIGDSGFGDFVSSKINISCLDGTVHVAFKYLGADGGAETRYHIDDIKVTGM